MALFDNKYWLLSHIRNSFMSTDETGMCDLVMSGEIRDIQTHLKSKEPYPDPESSEDDDDDFENFELQVDMDLNIRERSNTAVQIEKLELMRKKAAKIKHIKWETHQDLDSDTLNDLFIRKDVTKIKKPVNKTSKLSDLIHSHAATPKNPFMEYAKFDGTGQVNLPVKKYKIYLTIVPAQQRYYPMQVCCIATAKVQELIGLILLKHSYKNGTANLKDPSYYGLYLTEEDGEVDSDFPCLDSKEPISKYGFNCLGLVEHEEGAKSVSFPEDNTTLVVIEELNRVRTISEKSKADETKQMQNDIQAVEDHNKLMEAPIYRSFRAFMISKVKPKIEVNIGVSGDRIEIDPLPQKGSKLLPFKVKAISFSTDNIASCEITEEKVNKTCFRILIGTSASTNLGENAFSGLASLPPSSNVSSYKHYDFEGNHVTIQDLVQKLKLILELKCSSTREEFLLTKEKKLQKKKSFHIVK